MREATGSPRDGSGVAQSMVIGGELVQANSGALTDVVDPATGNVIARVPQGDATDVERAVRAAEHGFEQSWSMWGPTERGARLRRLADLVRENAEDLARLESENIGKPVTSARGDAQSVAAVFDYYAGTVDKFLGETIPTGSHALDFTLREPIGVVGLIVPWNYPMVMASWKLGPALAAGNTCILKPASYSPLTALRLAELALEAGFPPGVVNVVTGPGEAVGAAIAGHPRIGKVAFTGETSTGQSVMRLAAGNVKKVSLELGGKSANIVFADADIERFARDAAYAIFDNCGQDCTARSRILVERGAHDEVLDLLLAATRRLVVGDPRDERTEIGPLVSVRQRDRVMRYVQVGRDEGARLVLGGDVPPNPQLAVGAFLQPTVFDNVSNSMRIAQEEIFGPVVTVTSFEDEAEAAALANASPYGLSGSIWTRDLGKAMRTARRVRSGVLSVNSNRSIHIAAPFGGYKLSGLGRELGMHALELYSEIKNIYVDLT